MLLTALALTSCAPLLATVQGEAGSLSRGAGEQILLRNPGPTPMLAPTVRVEGPGLVMGDKYCDPAGTDPERGTAIWHCGTEAKPIPDVPVGGFTSLTPIPDKAGVVRRIQIATATFKRPGRFLPVRLELP